MKKLFVGLVVGALPIVFASCNSADNSSNGGSWQSGQTSAVLNAASGSASQVNSANVVTIQSTHGISSVDTTVPCTGGGSASVSGSLQGAQTGTYPNDTMTLSYTYTFTFNQCVSSGNDGNYYTVSGTGITLMGSSDWVNSGTGLSASFVGKDNFSIEGNVDVTGNESLNCDIDLSQATTTSETGGVFNETGSYSGTVCGQTEDGNISINGAVSSSSVYSG
jgi:hypothetical protein